MPGPLVRIARSAAQSAQGMRNTAAPCYEGPGAMVGNLFMSLIHTAELQHREPFDYLVTLLRHEAAVAPLAPATWMPWNYTATLAHLAAEPTDSTAD